ncbi:ABC transporter substrate-binding protein [Nonomuraea salmonea]|uniref:ABC transporter substrate-binding protein n=1 Tax=Nonomuraea salmonea TaxID=46181 RepID=UPI002FEA6F59
MRAMLDAFNQQFAGRIEVRNVTRRWEDLYPAMPTAISAGKGPDVAVIHNDWIGTFAVRKVLIPIDDVVGALGLTEGDFIPAVWQAGLYGGKRYSVPPSTCTAWATTTTPRTWRRSGSRRRRPSGPRTRTRSPS